jgi:hypothetical protein
MSMCTMIIHSIVMSCVKGLRHNLQLKDTLKFNSQERKKIQKEISNMKQGIKKQIILFLYVSIYFWDLCFVLSYNNKLVSGAIILRDPWIDRNKNGNRNIIIHNNVITNTDGEEYELWAADYSSWKVGSLGGNII